METAVVKCRLNDTFQVDNEKFEGFAVVAGIILLKLEYFSQIKVNLQTSQNNVQVFLDNSVLGTQFVDGQRIDIKPVKLPSPQILFVEPGFDEKIQIFSTKNMKNSKIISVYTKRSCGCVPMIPQLHGYFEFIDPENGKFKVKDSNLTQNDFNFIGFNNCEICKAIDLKINQEQREFFSETKEETKNDKGPGDSEPFSFKKVPLADPLGNFNSLRVSPEAEEQNCGRFGKNFYHHNPAGNGQFFRLADSVHKIEVKNVDESYLHPSLLLRCYSLAFHFFTQKDKSFGGFLISGEPGTGKKELVDFFEKIFKYSRSEYNSIHIFKKPSERLYDHLIDELSYKDLGSWSSFNAYTVNKDIEKLNIANLHHINLKRPGQYSISKFFGGNEWIAKQCNGLNFHECKKIFRELTAFGAVTPLENGISKDGRIQNQSEDQKIIKPIFPECQRNISLLRKILAEFGHKPESKTSFDDIAGYSEIKKTLLEIITKPFPSLIEYPNGVLLHGPPGCSKTLFAKALATHCNRKFIAVNAANLQSKFVGQAEDNLKRLFEENSHSLIFIDEIDSVGMNRDKCEEHGIKLLNTLLYCLDGLETSQNYRDHHNDEDCESELSSTKYSKPIVIGATNRIKALDPALLRPGRFEKIILVDLPNRNDRYEIIWMYMMKFYGKNKPNFVEDRRFYELNSEIDTKNSSELDLASNQRKLHCMFCQKEITRDESSFISTCKLDFEKILDATEGLSCAEIKGTISEAKRIFVKKTNQIYDHNAVQDSNDTISYKKCDQYVWTEIILDAIKIIKSERSEEVQK